jgi:DNA-binding transcriptional LysR family regulator
MKADCRSDMRTNNLETFLWTVRLGSLSAAAERLNLTQSAVTRRIQELERDLGAKLFRRAGRLVTPTSVAQALLPKAELILHEIDAMRATTRDIDEIQGRVRIGIAELIGLTWLDRLLSRLEDSFPNLNVEIEVEVASGLVEGLNRRRLDVVFLPGKPAIDGVSQEAIGCRALRWVAHPDLATAHKICSPEVLQDEPIILMPKGAEWHDLAMRWFAASSARPKRVRTCNSVSVQTSLVKKGFGFSVMPTDLISEEIANGSLIALPGLPSLPDVSYSAAYITSEATSVISRIVSLARSESQFIDIPSLLSRV